MNVKFYLRYFKHDTYRSVSVKNTILKTALSEFKKLFSLTGF